MLSVKWEHPFSLLSAMQFLRSDGGNLGGNGGNNVVDANSIYLTLTLTFIIFVSVVVKCYLPFTLNFMRFFSVEGKYFIGAFSFVYCTSIFAF